MGLGSRIVDERGDVGYGPENLSVLDKMTIFDDFLTTYDDVLTILVAGAQRFSGRGFVCNQRLAGRSGNEMKGY